MPSFSPPSPTVSGTLTATSPGWWVSELPCLLCPFLGASRHLAVWSFASTHAEGGFATGALSSALGNCQHQTDAAALFMAAFLWGTNPLAGVEFQSMIPNTFPSLETFIFREVLVVWEKYAFFQSPPFLALKGRTLRSCREVRQARTVNRPNALPGGGGAVWFGGFSAGVSVKWVPKASWVFLELSCQSLKKSRKGHLECCHLNGSSYFFLLVWSIF